MRSSGINLIPFRAFWAAQPWGVLCFETDSFRLFTGRQWLRHRGGISAHYADLAAGRTQMVDQIHFDAWHPPGLARDEIGRLVAKIDFQIALAIFASADWVDERYLGRCFDRLDAQRMGDAMHVLSLRSEGKQLPSWLAEAAWEI